MNDLLKLCPHQPLDIALLNDDKSVTFSELELITQYVADQIDGYESNVIASLMDNSLAWVVFDLALISSKKVHLPLPPFFTEEQRNYASKSAGAQILVSDVPLDGLDLIDQFNVFGSELFVYKQDVEQVNLHVGTQKITFTSGSTGQPKGVCLSLENQLTVAKSLKEKIAVPWPKHLSVLPFSVLLENVAGIYAPLLAGGKVIVSSLTQLGFSGTSLSDPTAFLTRIGTTNPETMILVPELLKVLVLSASTGWTAPASLSFVAVGGAQVPKTLLETAQAFNIPAFQGYGLSEAGSVVALNVGTQDGSVGEILSHLEAKIVDGELCVKGPLFLGYLGQPSFNQGQWLATGDLVEMDEERVVISGRSKNLIISSLGRNISPEWPESALQSAPWLLQCVVFGEAQPFLVAVIYALPTITNEQIEKHVEQINLQLPAYAKVNRWFRLNTPMSPESGLLTANGRPKRDAIALHFQDEIAELYQTSRIA